jgi:hypothetical protein
MKRLRSIKRRYFKRCANTDDVVVKLWGFWQEQHEKSEPTEDLHLLDATPCPTRFQLQEAHFCGWGLPSRKPRKLKSLKECEICLAKNKQKIQKVAIAKAGLEVPRNIVGKGLIDKTKNLKAFAQSLADGKYRRYCLILTKSLKLFDLPCVVNSDGFKQPYDCRHKDCQAQIEMYVRAYYLDTL